MIEIYQRHALPVSTYPERTEELGELDTTQKKHEQAQLRPRNPVIHMYVYPHTSKVDGVRIPGYWTAIELDEREELSTIHMSD